LVDATNSLSNTLLSTPLRLFGALAAIYDLAVEVILVAVNGNVEQPADVSLDTALLHSTGVYNADADAWYLGGPRWGSTGGVYIAPGFAAQPTEESLDSDLKQARGNCTMQGSDNLTLGTHHNCEQWTEAGVEFRR
jgi:hypothetical protein